jgi:hypothetical protein
LHGISIAHIRRAYLFAIGHEPYNVVCEYAVNVEAKGVDGFELGFVIHVG